MYTACVFCTADLGRNEVVEHFPVGRRLAFDAARGLLWVVCPRCARWNLTPVEERWEAIEECERLFRDTRLRASTDNIGLARMRDGTDLVRIGRPLRPELAAWRYGDRFGRRRRRALVRSSIGGAAVAGAAIAIPALGIPMAGVLLAGGVATWIGVIVAATNGGSLGAGWLRHQDGEWLLVPGEAIPSARLVALPDESAGWGVRVPFSLKLPERRLPASLDHAEHLPPMHDATLVGGAAMDVARQLLTRFNGDGAESSLVRDACTTLDGLGTGEEAFRNASARVREISARQNVGDSGALRYLPADVRLALEMAAHEDVERQAMAGELADLERAWRDAAELATIAESLVEPAGIAGKLDALKRRAR